MAATARTGRRAARQAHAHLRGDGDITSEEDLRNAVEKVAAYVETLPTERKVAVMGGEHGPDTDQKVFRSGSYSKTSR